MKHNRQGFIGWFIRQVLDGEEIQVFGDGQQRRDMVYVDDVVEAFLLAGQDDRANGGIFNVGGPERVSLLEFVQVLVKIAGSGSYKVVPFPPNRKSIDIGDYYADCAKIHRTLGWAPRVTLREGLEKTVRFYEENRSHYW
jgi:UDP-glucose 4-epimerase